jgi:hypothetical protein
MESLARIILAKYNANKLEGSYKDGFEYPLELATIDDMPIYAFFIIKKNYKYIKFYINSKTIIDLNNEFDSVIYYQKIVFEKDPLEKSSKKIVEYTIEDIIQAINQLREILPILKFNIMIGQFVIDNTATEEILALQSTLSFDNVTFVYDTCPVCSEMTKTKTKCNHPLCYKCWEKLPIVICETGNCNQQICPICRTVINHLLDGDEDDEGDEDEEDEEDDSDEGDYEID